MTKPKITITRPDESITVDIQISCIATQTYHTKLPARKVTKFINDNDQHGLRMAVEESEEFRHTDWKDFDALDMEEILLSNKYGMVEWKINIPGQKKCEFKLVKDRKYTMCEDCFDD
tara:strand:- start:435 stop:785 length:351 start_codon:yes stop_codon:yes gene_type:complete